MRPPPTTCIAAVCLVAAFASHAAAPTTPDPEPQPPAVTIRAATQAMLDAVALGDAATWDRWLDPAYLHVDENATVRTRAELLAELKPLPPGLTGRMSIAEFRTTEAGDTLVATHLDAEELDYHGQKIASRYRTTDTWHRTPAGWRLLATQTLAVLEDPPAITLDRRTLCSYAGRYALTKDIAVRIDCAGDRLVAKREGRPDRTFAAEVRDVFFEPGQPRTRRIFTRDAAGRLTGFVDRREGRDVVWKKVG